MDSTDSARTNPPEHGAVSQEGRHSSSVSVEHEAICWGCGLRVIVFPCASIFRCGWCGAITKEKVVKNKSFRCRLALDRCSVGFVLVYMLLYICGGIWAVYPIVFSISYFCGIFHFVVTMILALCTLSAFGLSAFRPAGAQPMMPWGSYPAVGKDELENFTFCHYCSKPKSPRTHHCRSCGICVLDMDHHCPFIGNCVGSANHRSFILFLISAVVSTSYAAIMTWNAAHRAWLPPDHKTDSLGSTGDSMLKILKENMVEFVISMMFQPVRVLALFYIFLASFSVGIGLSVLLWQQLSYIYAGKTYLSQLNSEDKSEGDYRNILRFFGCPLYLPSYWKARKSHEK